MNQFIELDQRTTRLNRAQTEWQEKQEQIVLESPRDWTLILDPPHPPAKEGWVIFWLFQTIVWKNFVANFFLTP